MIKKRYTVSGFDCAVCASKAEAHIAKQKGVISARMDFANNKLYISFDSNPWGVETLRKVIAEVEGDPLNIYEEGEAINSKINVFNLRMRILLIRIISVVLITAINMFVLKDSGLTLLRTILYGVGIIIIGYDIFYKVFLHIRNLNNILDHFLLISIAALGSFVISILEINEDHSVTIGAITFAMDEGMESIMVITLFQIGQIIESYATNKSKNAVMSAIELRVDKATKITENGVKIVKPEELSIDDCIVITSGELVPVDGIVYEGEAYVDTSSLTGEYVPVFAKQDTKVFSGCMIKSGSIKVKVLKKYEESTISRIIDMISEGGEQKSKADEFIAKFAKIYTPIVVGLAIVTFLIGGLISNEWESWIHTGLEILVIGCPCAIVISVPLAYFSAIGLGSKNGIVIKGANYLDKLCDLGTLICDKTGTLTHGSFNVSKINNIGLDKKEFMEYLYAVECLSKHPIGKAICHDEKLTIPTHHVKDFEEIAGLGAKCTYNEHKIIAGGERLFARENVPFTVAIESGTIVYLGVDGKYVGYVVLSDELKDNAQPMVDLLHSEKVRLVLLTGDKEENAKEVCKNLGIDFWYSELLPEEKMKYLEQEMNDTKKSVAYIGDGINDAPSIIRSDIGIAMGGIGSDVAVENADMVIMNDDPAKVYDAMIVAKKARNTSIFNIAFALFVKLAVYILAIFFGSEAWMMYVAILADTGLTVILVINSLLLLYRKIKRPIL